MTRCSRRCSSGKGKASARCILRLFCLKSGAVLLHDLIVIGLMIMVSALSGQGGKALHRGLRKDLLTASVGLNTVLCPGRRLRLHLGCREMNFMLFFKLFDHNRTRRMP